MYVYWILDMLMYICMYDRSSRMTRQQNKRRMSCQFQPCVMPLRFAPPRMPTIDICGASTVPRSWSAPYCWLSERIVSARRGIHWVLLPSLLTQLFRYQCCSHRQCWWLTSTHTTNRSRTATPTATILLLLDLLPQKTHYYYYVFFGKRQRPKNNLRGSIHPSNV